MKNPPKKKPKSVPLLVPNEVAQPAANLKRAELAIEVGRLAAQIRERTAQIRDSLKASRQF